MKQQIVITKTVLQWYNVKNTNGDILLNIPPDIFHENFPEISSNIALACMEINFDRIEKLMKVGN